MDPYLGTIIIFSGNYEIKGWAFCNGQSLSISQYSALFSILGTTYGGNGVQTFNLPNLQGRTPIGMGAGQGLSSYQLGQAGDTQQVTLTVNNLPAHTHAAVMSGTSAAAASGSPAGALLATQPRTSTVMPFASGNADTNMATTAVQVANTGASSPVGIMQPYLSVNFLIALQGIYPSRN